jgi:type IV pilus assembly protein PilV
MLMITTPTKEKGFTLIEVLVSLLILSIGIFGMLAVIVTSLQMNSSSVYRTIAAQQAYAMAETLRANPTALGTANPVSSVAFSAATSAVTITCLQAAGCTVGSTATNGFVQMALYMWQQQLALVLPSGTGTVCQDGTPNDGTSANWLCDGPSGTQTPMNPLAPYVVKVCWDESRISASTAVTNTGGTTSSGGGALCTYTSL